MNDTITAPTPRSLEQRRLDAQRTLQQNHQLWLCTAAGDHGHMIPVSYVLEGSDLILATATRSRTMANVRATGRARVAIGSTDDVVMIDGQVAVVPVADMDPDTADAYAVVSHDPRVMPGFEYLRLAPSRIQVWNGFHEFGGRTVMADSQWLSRPVD
ncbi:pyridoxamine 5'-phosphate oxidase family protein [Haloactinopolyspora alba]|uniref:pyridoxamine 5'-phosphate oxidase family protein n=1 Tax=Haloactinopolyspora alba TaxID=648780 RepID=UPI00197A7ED6|nr:pyridoxamine 5'-phosphate oxidase family protein [Haloactinopolyspora alba]